LQAQAASIKDVIIMERFSQHPKGNPAKQAEVMRLCTSELEAARTGDADELLKFFPGKELLPAIEKFVGTVDSREILETLVQAGDEALQIEPLVGFRNTLLGVLDL
jgi:hypothetical protein